MDLFDSPDKWNSFCELMNRNGEIQNRWWKKLQTEVYQREKRNGNPDWDITIWNHWDMKWSIRNENPQSLMIHFYGDAFRLFSNAGYLDMSKVGELLKDPKFSILQTCFDRIDGSDFQTIGWEYRNFYFDTVYDGRFPDARTLSWYAGNKTAEFADQLINKVRKFQTPEMTELIKEINIKCKK